MKRVYVGGIDLRSGSAGCRVVNEELIVSVGTDQPNRLPVFPWNGARELHQEIE